MIAAWNLPAFISIDRVVEGARRQGFRIELSQQRMFHATRCDTAYRQIVLFRDGLDDVTTPLTADVQLAVDLQIADHRVELGRRATLGLENTL